jgi:hypothetical protein
MKPQYTLSEDQALRLGTTLKKLVDEQIKRGHKIVHTYFHPAVGKCVVLE